MTTDRPLTPESLAERWQCTPAHVRNLCRRGDLPHFRIGKEYRIPLHVVEGIERCEPGPTAPATPRERPFIPRLPIRT
jgi:excisionase family DNA binding protein